MIKYILSIFLFIANIHAEEIIGSIANPENETTIFAEAANSDNTFNQIFLEQPQNAPNPLGNPIYYTHSSLPKIFAAQPVKPNAEQTSPAPTIFSETSPQNPTISQMSPQAVDTEIQNKLYQSGNRIYDIQSYPANDINYINQNNQDNAVTDYPAY